MKFLKGLLFGLLFGLALWALLVIGFRRMEHTTPKLRCWTGKGYTECSRIEEQ